MNVNSLFSACCKRDRDAEEFLVPWAGFEARITFSRTCRQIRQADQADQAQIRYRTEGSQIKHGRRKESRRELAGVKGSIDRVRILCSRTRTARHVCVNSLN